MKSEPFNGKLRRTGITLTLLALLVATFLAYYYFPPTRVVEAQARLQKRNPSRSRTRVQTQVNKVPTFTGFKHESHRAPKTKLSCSDCHTITNQAAPDEIVAATKPSIKGYPYHNSCLECHRRTPPQFFSGAAPTICTVCHTRSSPRLTARDVSPFPKHSEQVMELEFPGYFPHDQRDHKRVNCATCHLTDERTYLPIPVGGSENYKPAEGTFKTSPSGHAACFKCHWEDEKPKKDDCARCHLTPDSVAQKPRNLVSASAMEWFKNWPREWPTRLSLKFNHESKDHDEECTTCHDLTKIETLDIVKAEVPIAACKRCHFPSTARTSIGKEMFEEDDDIAEGRNNNPASREGKHTCTGCHVMTIGGMPPPCSHYLLFDETYFSKEDYPKSAEQIAARCKK